MTDSRTRSIRWCSATMIALTLIVYGAERNRQLTSIRLTAHNLLAPGRLALLSISGTQATSEEQRDHGPTAEPRELAELQQALLENELQRRQLLIENAKLNYQLQTKMQMANAESVARDGLVEFRGHRATILSHTGPSDSLVAAIVDAGESAGLKRSQLVVSGSGIVIDQGSENGIQTDQKVSSGVAVVGRIDQVSRWVSLVRPVTDSEFSAAVQIVKTTTYGAAYGAKGLLEGTGDSTCRITGIPYTEAVAVGDEVFSADINGTEGPRLYYGQITEAEYSSGGEWVITVQPAVRPRDLSRVTVVQLKLNTEITGD